MRYRTTKCPHCGYILENMAMGAKSWVGPPTVKCPSCHNLIKTGMNYWSEMTILKKILYLGFLTISIPATIFVFSAMWLLISYIVLYFFTSASWISDFIDNHDLLVKGYVVVTMIIFFILNVGGVIMEIKEKPGDKTPFWTR